MKILLECGANPNARNKAGATPLRFAAASEGHLSIKKSFRDVAELLLAKNADINAANDQGTLKSKLSKDEPSLPLILHDRKHAITCSRKQGGLLGEHLLSHDQRR